MARRFVTALVILGGATFVVGLVAGFVVPIDSHGIECGEPLNVIDGRFASGVPDDVKGYCQSAANRWIGFALLPVFAFLVPVVIIGVVLQRRGKF